MSDTTSAHRALPQTSANLVSVLPEGLNRLLVNLCCDPLPQLPTLAKLSCGQFQFRGVQHADLTAQLTLDQQSGSIQLSGGDQRVGWSLVSRVASEPAYDLINDSMDLELLDGSQLHAESVIPAQIAGRWQCRLDRWLWWIREDVRYWIGTSIGATLPRAKNLHVAKGSDFWPGIHIPGRESIPSITLLERISSENSRSVTIVVASRGDVVWARCTLPGVATVLRASLGLPTPSFFLGVDNEGVVCAATSWAPNPDDLKWLPMPLSCVGADSLLAPSGYGGGLVWIAPLLTHLMDDLFSPVNKTIDALDLFRLALSESVMHDQLAKIARAIRVLVRRNHAHSDVADYLESDSFWNQLSTFTQMKHIIIPNGSKEALHLAYELALVGDCGLHEFKYSKPDIEDHNRLLRAIETLRTTFASLLAGLIGYKGPVSLRVSGDQSKIDLHQPNRVDVGDVSTPDEHLARKRFCAGDEVPIS